VRPASPLDRSLRLRSSGEAEWGGAFARLGVVPKPDSAGTGPVGQSARPEVHHRIVKERRAALRLQPEDALERMSYAYHSCRSSARCAVPAGACCVRLVPP